MRSHAEEPAAPPMPTTAHHGKKASVEEVFEHRWRKAYEVRAMERESRQAKSQASSRCSSADSQRVAKTALCTAGKPSAAAADAAAIQVQSAPGRAAEEAVGKLSLGSTEQPTGNGIATAAAAASSAGEEKALRQQEVVDDDDEPAPASPAGGAGAALQRSHWQAAGRQQQPGGQGEDDDDEGLACKVVWDSSPAQAGAAARVPAADTDMAAFGGAGASILQLKEQGNICLKAGDFEGAVRCYSEALSACKQSRRAAQQAAPLQAAPQPAQQDQQGDPPSHQQHPAAEGQREATGHQLLATLHSNRAHALLRLKRNEEAAVDALLAHRLHPSWPKPLYRLAQAKLAQRQWAAAVAACRQGHALAPKNSEGHTEFTPLLDRTAVAAARVGSLAGYDGLQLEVRSAGKDAWMGRAAPHVPELDGPEDEDTIGVVTHLPLPSSSGGGGGGGGGGNGGGALVAAGAANGDGRAGSGASAGDTLVAWDYHQAGEAGKRRRTSFRSVREAVEAARDGDRILLRCGTHNGMGECVTVAKRLLIEGEGVLGDAVLDQRANVPAFRIVRGGVVLRNLDIDFTGLREALLVEGPPGAHPSPLVAGCRIKCSGDDAVNVGGAAAPTFLRCELSGKKCGVKALGSSAPRLERCTITKCGEQGVRAMEAAAPVLQGCIISECAEEGALAMDAARLSLTACTLRDCKGPGVDVSGGASAAVTGGTIEQCVGGVWLWDAGRATLQAASVAGGPSHAILADGTASLEVRESTVRGTVHASDAAWAGILHPSNRLLDPEQPTDFPPEEGPFRFVPNPYTRKQ